MGGDVFEGARNVAIWGFGREGHAALAWLRARHPELPVAILNDAPLPSAPEGVDVWTGEDADAALRQGRFDVVVKSPGVSLYRPELVEARERGTRLASGVNLWFADNPNAHTIAVTGTKGKSTTSRLIHHMLRAAGRDAALIGNVGVAALGQPAGADHTVLELSSYQIADLDAAPSVALVTNLYVDHTPWHGGVAQYHHDKLRLLRSESTHAVLNANSDKLVAAMGERRNATWYGRPDGFHAREGRLLFRDRVVDTSSFPLRGMHNLENLAGACTVLDAVGVTSVRERVDLSGFAQLRHRQEEFRGRGGRLCVNDSISTVPEATLVALRAYGDRRVALFLGGTDRGQDHAELLDYLAGANIACAILLPDTGARIAHEMAGREWPFPIVSAGDLAQGVEAAMRTGEECVLLLSPAAPSFGQFRDFEERGDRFIALCGA
ncbi:MAG: UDP-N-acetylmuramoyl-L-alanine--D-glutamate ligase [Hyphomicrobiales bacterium]|nr:UDP-N-acetylmuramoyl-L-alanine--D-glutamate ligase [Hyphomicrobiales bacterium]